MDPSEFGGDDARLARLAERVRKAVRQARRQVEAARVLRHARAHFRARPPHSFVRPHGRYDSN